MKGKISSLLVLLYLTWGHAVPVEEYPVTETIVDATTISTVDSVSPTISPLGLSVNEDIIPENEKPGKHCTTARGYKGSCSHIQDCYKVLFPTDFKNRTKSQGPAYNEELAMMLVERAGFCDDDPEKKLSRSPMTPIVFNQVMRSEVQICCKVDEEPQEYKLDEPSEDAFKADGCGQLKIDIQSLDNVDGTPMENATDAERIVRGRKTKPGEFPWIVAMMNRGRQFCGGSLINSKTIMTAAHCVEQMQANDVKNLKLHIGDYDIYTKSDGPHVTRSAVAIKYHKGFSQRHLRNDIALIIMDQPVQYTDRIQPVCLHTGNPKVDDGTKRSDVAGWGTLSEGGKQPSDLRSVNVRVLTRAQCLQKYKGSQGSKIVDGMLCAGSDMGEDSCQGDSGGPLTVDSRNQAKQIGVVSWGVGCGRYPGVYTAVYRYLSWIDKHKATE